MVFVDFSNFQWHPEPHGAVFSGIDLVSLLVFMITYYANLLKPILEGSPMSFLSILLCSIDLAISSKDLSTPSR